MKKATVFLLVFTLLLSGCSEPIVGDITVGGSSGESSVSMSSAVPSSDVPPPSSASEAVVESSSSEPQMASVPDVVTPSETSAPSPPSPSPSSVAPSVQPPDSAPLQSEGSEVQRIGYNLLSDSEQVLYEKIFEMLDTRSPELVLEENEHEYLSDVWAVVLRDNPLFRWSDSYVLETVTLGEQKTRTVRPDYGLSDEEHESRLQQINVGTKLILSPVSSEWSDYEKAKFVYTSLAMAVEYNVSENDQDVYGALVERVAVCGGYSRTLQHLLNTLGIPCIQVTGEAVDRVGGTTSSEAHSWNMALLDGEYYLIDATWGDSAQATLQTPENVNYDFFCVTTEDLKESHFPDDTLTLPDCTAIANQYYIKEGAWLDSFDEDTIKAIFSGQQDEGYFYLRCADTDTYNAVLAYLFEQGGVYSILNSLPTYTEENVTRISYQSDDIMRSLRVYPVG